MDDHGGLILTCQMAEGDVGGFMDHMFAQRVVQRTVCEEEETETTTIITDVSELFMGLSWTSQLNTEESDIRRRKRTRCAG